MEHEATTATTATTATSLTYTHMALFRDLIEAVDLGGKAAWEVMSSGDKTCEPFSSLRTMLDVFLRSLHMSLPFLDEFHPCTRLQEFVSVDSLLIPEKDNKTSY